MAGHRQLLEAYIVRGTLRSNGDEDMICPLHDDRRRSATINFSEGVWTCHACEGGGTIKNLMRVRASWREPGVGTGTISAPHRPSTAPAARSGATLGLPSPARLAGFTGRLAADGERFDYLSSDRGLDHQTVQRYGIGWNGNRYTLPIYDDSGRLANVRYFQPDGDPKWVNHRGYGSPPKLFPMDVILENDELIWCEGEMDCMLTNQKGLPAFTATGGAKIKWLPEWSELFRDKVITLCFDRDKDGKNAINRVKPNLSKVTAEVRIIELPFPLLDKHGQDLTDFWLAGGTTSELLGLVKSEGETQAPQLHDYEALHGDGSMNRPLSVKGVVSSVEGPFLLMPKQVSFTCSQDWKPPACSTCALGRAGGSKSWVIEPWSDINLDLIQNKDRTKVPAIIAKGCGIPKSCPLFMMDEESRTAWHGEIRNGSNIAADAVPVMFYATKHPTLGDALELSGRLKQRQNRESLFVVHGTEPVDTELDKFQLSQAEVWGIRRILEDIIPDDKDPHDPKDQLDAMAQWKEDHITRIFGQRWLHIVVDLVYHSVLRFSMRGEEVRRGWLEALIVGQTRVGKSTTVHKLADWYGLGEIIPCEKISIPGLISTSERRGSGKDNWVARMGKLPLLDRQLIAFDEAQGLSIEQIGQLSDARSEGVIKVTQAASLEANARVRMIWLGNSRTKHTGIQALQQMMGKDEDLARIDLPLYVVSGMSDHDNDRRSTDRPRDSYNIDIPALWRAKVKWAWSRKPEDVKWAPKAIEYLYRSSDVIARKYHSDIPVMPENEARIRLARLSAAVAAATFSTPDGRNLLIERRHVDTAAWVIVHLLRDKNLEYMQEARAAKMDVDAGFNNRAELKALYLQNPEITELLRGSVVTRKLLFDFVGGEGGYIIGRLTSLRAIKHHGNDQLGVLPWAREVAMEVLDES